MKLLLFIFFTCSFIYPNLGLTDFQCRHLFASKYKTIEGEVDYSSSTPDSFHVRVLKNWFYFKADLQDGHLNIKAHLVDHNEKNRSSLHGSDLFREMIEYFGINQIRIIEGRWFESSEANYGAFIRAVTVDGLSDSNAAFKTWTGRQALKFGYTFVHVERASVRVLNNTIEYIKADFSKTPFNQKPTEKPYLSPPPRFSRNY